LLSSVLYSPYRIAFVLLYNFLRLHRPLVV
jgi:hypothetical protein